MYIDVKFSMQERLNIFILLYINKYNWLFKYSYSFENNSRIISNKEQMNETKLI